MEAIIIVSIVVFVWYRFNIFNKNRCTIISRLLREMHPGISDAAISAKSVSILSSYDDKEFAALQADYSAWKAQMELQKKQAQERLELSIRVRNMIREMTAEDPLSDAALVAKSEPILNDPTQFAELKEEFFKWGKLPRCSFPNCSFRCRTNPVLCRNHDQLVCDVTDCDNKPLGLSNGTWISSCSGCHSQKEQKEKRLAKIARVSKMILATTANKPISATALEAHAETLVNDPKKLAELEQEYSEWFLRPFCTFPKCTNRCLPNNTSRCHIHDLLRCDYLGCRHEPFGLRNGVWIKACLEHVCVYCDRYTVTRFKASCHSCVIPTPPTTIPCSAFKPDSTPCGNTVGVKLRALQPGVPDSRLICNSHYLSKYGRARK